MKFKRGDKVRVVDTGRGLTLDRFASKEGLVCNVEPKGSVDSVFNIPTPADSVIIWFEDMSLVPFEDTSVEGWEIGLFSSSMDGVEHA